PLARLEHRRNRMARCQRDDLDHAGGEECTRDHDQPTRFVPNQLSESRRYLLAAFRIENLDGLSDRGGRCPQLSASRIGNRAFRVPECCEERTLRQSFAQQTKALWAECGDETVAANLATGLSTEGH